MGPLREKLAQFGLQIITETFAGIKADVEQLREEAQQMKRKLAAQARLIRKATERLREATAAARRQNSPYIDLRRN